MQGIPAFLDNLIVTFLVLGTGAVQRTEQNHHLSCKIICIKTVFHFVAVLYACAHTHYLLGMCQNGEEGAMTGHVDRYHW